MFTITFHRHKNETVVFGFPEELDISRMLRFICKNYGHTGKVIDDDMDGEGMYFKGDATIDVRAFIAEQLNASDEEITCLVS